MFARVVEAPGLAHGDGSLGFLFALFVLLFVAVVVVLLMLMMMPMGVRVRVVRCAALMYSRIDARLKKACDPKPSTPDFRLMGDADAPRGRFVVTGCRSALAYHETPARQDAGVSLLPADSNGMTPRTLGPESLPSGGSTDDSVG